jgi:hypothetical protein
MALAWKEEMKWLDDILWVNLEALDGDEESEFDEEQGR